MNWTSDTPIEIYLDWLEDQGEDVMQLRMLDSMLFSPGAIRSIFQDQGEGLEWKREYGSGFLHDHTLWTGDAIGCDSRYIAVYAIYAFGYGDGDGRR